MINCDVEYDKRTVCANCGSEYVNETGFVFHNKGNADPEKGSYWESKCTECGTYNKTPLKAIVPKNNVFLRGIRKGKAKPPRATHRPIGTNLRRAKRDKWFEKPADLEEKLAEERRLRAQNSGEEGEDGG